MSVTSVVPVSTLPLNLVSGLQLPLPSMQAPGSVSFGQMLVNGMEGVNKKLMDADNMVRAFAVDDSIPVHQVMFALNQARSSMDMAMQVRARLLEGYQQLMNMQL
jgi:flagellar hook-basal body complex protein FliE